MASINSRTCGGWSFGRRGVVDGPQAVRDMLRAVVGRPNRERTDPTSSGDRAQQVAYYCEC